MMTDARRKSQSLYRKRNATRIKAVRRAHYRKNRQRVLARHRAYYRKNKRRILRRIEVYKASRPEQVAAWKTAAWRRLSPEQRREKKRAWRRRHPEKDTEQSHLRLARLSGAPVGDRKAILAFFRRLKKAKRLRCFWCGRVLLNRPRERTADHIIPLARGGTHSVDNLCVACMSCNCTKRHRLPAEFLEYLGVKTATRRAG